MASNDKLLKSLVENLTSESKDSLTRENILGCLQKLSLRCGTSSHCQRLSVGVSRSRGKGAFHVRLMHVLQTADADANDRGGHHRLAGRGAGRQRLPVRLHTRVFRGAAHEPLPQIRWCVANTGLVMLPGSEHSFGRALWFRCRKRSAMNCVTDFFFASRFQANEGASQTRSRC